MIILKSFLQGKQMYFFKSESPELYKIKKNEKQTIKEVAGIETYKLNSRFQTLI